VPHRPALLAFVAAIASWGCAPDKATQSTPAGPFEVNWGPGAATSDVRVQVEPLGQVSHSGLQLPVVSPDGKWIACFRVAGPAASREALLTGKGLEDVSLSVGPVAAPSAPGPVSPGEAALRPGAVGGARVVCPSGAAWPAWSPDSRFLVFSAFAPDGRCELAVYDLAAGATRRLAMGDQRAVMSAVSPSGRQVAVVLAGEGPESSGLCVLDLAGGKRVYCPLGPSDGAGPPVGARPSDAGGAEVAAGLSAGDAPRTRPAAEPPAPPPARPFWPHWVGEGRLVFFLCRDDRTWLAHWTVGDPKPTVLCGIDVPPTWPELLQALAGLGPPVSPDGSRLAYYERATDRVVLVDLADGGRVELPAGTRAGCWLGGLYVAAAAEELLLCAGSAASPPRLIRGAWLPRWADEATGRILLCGPGPHARAFSLTRLTVIKGR